MRVLLLILVIPMFIFHGAAYGQKNKKNKRFQDGPRVMQVIGDSLRRDSIVYYETEIGFLMPDLGQKFKGRWNIQVMRRQARAIPDTLQNSYFEFGDDTLFSAFVGCNQLTGKYIIKGPTIKFTVLNSLFNTCPDELEDWFIKLIRDRVSYFGIDEKVLYLKDGAYNIVFDCSRSKQEDHASAGSSFQK